jgi:hypothetical protein
MVVERLNSSSKKSHEVGEFLGFKIGSNGLPMSHFQYADGTLFNGEPTMINLLTIKSIQQCFGPTFGFRVNFMKSSIMGVNMVTNFPSLAENCLHCRLS